MKLKITSITMAVLLCGCSVKSENETTPAESKVSTISTEEISTVQTEHETMIEIQETTITATETESVHLEATDLGALYAEKLYSVLENNSEMKMYFDLYDLDGDDVPELIISDGMSHVCKCKIYTIEDEQLKQLVYDDIDRFGEYGEFLYDKENKYIISTHMGMGHSFDSFYHINQGYLEQIMIFEDNKGACENEDDAYFRVNGEDVTKDEYTNLRQEYYKHTDSTIQLGIHFDLNEDIVYETLNVRK